MRAVAWRGQAMIWVSHPVETPFVWLWPFGPGAIIMVTPNEGAKLDIAKWRRPDPATAPSQAKAAGLYMIATMSKHAAEDKGCSDAMMFDYRGYVAEATGANIFFVKDGGSYTNAGCIPKRDHTSNRDRHAERKRHQGKRTSHHARRAGKPLNNAG